jgi:hypothetical protein
MLRAENMKKGRILTTDTSIICHSLRFFVRDSLDFLLPLRLHIDKVAVVEVRIKEREKAAKTR